MRPGLVFAALAIAAVTAGCGSGGGSSHAGDSSRAGGQALFSENCAVCHSLNGRPSPRQQGGDLLGVHMTRAEMLEFVREMPVPHRMTPAEQQIVADYVRSIEARGS